MRNVKVWTVVGTVSDDNAERWKITGVFRGDQAAKRVPGGRFGFGLVVEATTGRRAKVRAARQYAAYMAGQLDYTVTTVEAGPPAGGAQPSAPGAARTRRAAQQAGTGRAGRDGGAVFRVNRR